jgi:hypothetical protein
MISANPSSAGSTITGIPEAGTSDTVKNLNYRCPVCGGIVDATIAEEILLHHEHVTHPREFLLRKPAA